MNIFGPIFAFDLVTSARRRRYFLLRMIYGALLLFVFWTAYATFSVMRSIDLKTAAMLAEGFFTSITIVQLLAVMFLGPGMAAGTISLERERRTIEYLFASDLTNTELVLGKLAARLIQIGCMIAVGVPIVAIGMLMGGISFERLLMMYAITLGTMVMVASLSVSLSVWTPRARDAVVRAYIMLFALMVLPIAVSELCKTLALQYRNLAFLQSVGKSVEWLELLNPFMTFQAIARGVGATWSETALIVGSQLAAAALFIGLSIAAVRRVHLKAAGKADKPKGRRRWWPSWRPGIGDRPMLWKEMFAEQAGIRLGIVARAALFAFAALIAYIGISSVYELWRSGQGFKRESVGEIAMLGVVVICFTLLLILARAATSITSEKDRQCWEPLLLTSLTPGEIIWAKLLGNIYVARGLLLFSFGLFLLPLAVIDFGFLPTLLLEWGTIALLTLFAAALGVFCSLRMTNSLRAMMLALPLGIFIGGGYLFCCVSCLINVGPRGDEGFVILAGAIPFLLAIPAIQYSAVTTSHSEPVWPTFFIGVFLYGVLTTLLVASSVGLAARSSVLPTSRAPSPPKLPTEK